MSDRLLRHLTHAEESDSQFSATFNITFTELRET